MKKVTKTNKLKKIIDVIKNFTITNKKGIIFFASGLLLGIVITILSNYGNIAKLENGKQLVVSVDKLKLTADDLYSNLKDKYGLNEILSKIDKHILEDKYKKQKEDAKEYAINYIDSLKSSYKENWSEFLEYYGFKNEEELKLSLISQHYLNLETREYVENKLSDSEINNYYENTIVGDISISHILIKPVYNSNATDDQIKTAKDTALNKAKNIIKELDNSDNVLMLFAELAKENSDDTNTKEKGGNLEYINASNYNYNAFSDAAYKLNSVGEYTNTPIETDEGYEIIIKNNKDKEKDTLNNLKTSITSILVTTKIDNDPSLIIKSMMNLRKKYNLKFEEPTMNSKYNDLMVTSIEDALKTE